MRADVPRVVLCHPDTAPALARRGADLVLSGHTHGGQIYIKGVTERLMRKVGLRFRRGHFDIGDRTRLYVTPGVGFSGITHRVGDGTAAEAILTPARRRARGARRRDRCVILRRWAAKQRRSGAVDTRRHASSYQPRS